MKHNLWVRNFGVLVTLALMALFVPVFAIDNWETIDQLSYIAQGEGPMEGHSSLEKQVVSAEDIKKNLNANLVLIGVNKLDTQTLAQLTWYENNQKFTEGFKLSSDWSFPDAIDLAIKQDYRLKVYPQNIQRPDLSWDMVMTIPQLSSRLTPEQLELLKSGQMIEPGNLGTQTFSLYDVDGLFDQLWGQMGTTLGERFGAGFDFSNPRSVSSGGITCKWGEEKEMKYRFGG